MHALKKSGVALLLGMAAFLFMPSAGADNGSVGIVLMHGKWGAPDRAINTLASALERKGFLVSTPEMPWSRRRSYDKSADDALNEIDAEVAKLREKGASRIVIAGHSLGAAGALAYAAHCKADAIVAIAPGHVPENRFVAAKLAEDVNKARNMASIGNGDGIDWFPDLNSGGRSARLRMTARTFLSYSDPSGAMNFSRNVASVKPGTLVLWVEPLGEAPSLRNNLMRIFNTLPQGLDVTLIEPDADHMTTPDRATARIVDWIESTIAGRQPKN
jgi:pimeloyl-ACP methyl ester carboxylesterase